MLEDTISLDGAQVQINTKKYFYITFVWLLSSVIGFATTESYDFICNKKYLLKEISGVD